MYLGWSFTALLDQKVAIWWGFFRLSASMCTDQHVTLWVNEVVNDHPNWMHLVIIRKLNNKLHYFLAELTHNEIAWCCFMLDWPLISDEVFLLRNFWPMAVFWSVVCKLLHICCYIVHTFQAQCTDNKQNMVLLHMLFFFLHHLEA